MLTEHQVLNALRNVIRKTYMPDTYFGLVQPVQKMQRMQVRHTDALADAV